MGEQTVIITKLKSFTSKKTEPATDYYVVEGLLKNLSTSDKSIGYDRIEIFVDKKDYEKLYSDFDPLMEIPVNVSLNGSRLNFDLAG